MRHGLHYIMATVLALFLWSCHDDNDIQPSPPDDAVKTVLMFLPWTGSETSASGSLYNYFLNNIRQVEDGIKQENGLGTTRLLVFIASDYTTAALIEVRYQGNECVRDTLKKYRNLDITGEDNLREVFEDAHTASPTKTYALLIGSHGSGWLPSGSTPWRSSSYTLSAPRRKAFGGQTAGTQIDIQTLADAITRSSIGKMEFVCFDDCYMANAETAYALRHSTDYLIASTSEILDIGIPYRNIWKYLYATPDYEQVCQEFLTYYTSYTYPYGSLTAVDCRQVESLVPLMRSMNQAAEGTAETERADAIGAVQPLDGFQNTVFYDFMDYVEQVSPDVSYTDEIRKALSQVVVSTVSTSRIFSIYVNTSNNTFAVRTNCGLTISDPTVNAAAIGCKTETEWWKATH